MSIPQPMTHDEFFSHATNHQYAKEFGPPPYGDKGLTELIQREGGIHLKTLLNLRQMRDLSDKDTVLDHLMDRDNGYGAIRRAIQYLKTKIPNDGTPLTIHSTPEELDELMKKIPEESRTGVLRFLKHFTGARTRHFKYLESPDSFDESTVNPSDVPEHIKKDPEFKDYLLSQVLSHKPVYHISSMNAIEHLADADMPPLSDEELQQVVDKAITPMSKGGLGLRVADIFGHQRFLNRHPTMVEKVLNHPEFNPRLSAAEIPYGVLEQVKTYLKDKKYTDPLRRMLAIRAMVGNQYAHELSKDELDDYLGQAYAADDPDSANFRRISPILNSFETSPKKWNEEQAKSLYDFLKKYMPNKLTPPILRQISNKTDIPFDVEDLKQYSKKPISINTLPIKMLYRIKGEDMDKLIPEQGANASPQEDENVMKMLKLWAVHNVNNESLTPKQKQFLKEYKNSYPASGNRLMAETEFEISKKLQDEGLGDGYVKSSKDLLRLIPILNSPHTHLEDILYHPKADHEVYEKLMDMNDQEPLQFQVQDASYDNDYDSTDILKRMFVRTKKLYGRPSMTDKSSSVANGLLGDLTHVKVGSAALRKLRDYLQEQGKTLRPEELPKDQTWNSLVKEVRGRDGNVNYVQDWNPLRDATGRLSHEKVAAHIDQMPIKKFLIHNQDDWNERLQSHSRAPTTIMSINLTPQTVDKLKENGLWGTFLDMGRSVNPAHPTTPYSLGWTRYSINHDNKEVFMDELQTDLFRRYRDVMTDDNESDHNKSKYKQTWDLLFGKVHAPELLHETALQFFRDQGLHDYKYHVHSVDSKRGVSIDSDPSNPAPAHMQDTYEKMPKKLGAKPSKYGTLSVETGDGDYSLKGKRTHGLEAIRKAEWKERRPSNFSEWLETVPLDEFKQYAQTPDVLLSELVSGYYNAVPDGTNITLQDLQNFEKEEEPFIAEKVNKVSSQQRLSLEDSMKDVRQDMYLALTRETPHGRLDPSIVKHLADLHTEGQLDSNYLVSNAVRIASHMTPELVDSVFKDDQMHPKQHPRLADTLMYHHLKNGESAKEVLDGMMRWAGNDVVAGKANFDQQSSFNLMLMKAHETQMDLPDPILKKKLTEIANQIPADHPEVFSYKFPGLHVDALLPYMNKENLNKYLDNAYANRRDEGTEVSGNVYENPNFGLDELLKANDFGIMHSIWGQLNNSEKEKFYGKVPVEKMAEIVKKPVRDGEADDVLKMASLADLSKHGGAFPEDFPETGGGRDPKLEDTGLGMRELISNNPTYTIPIKAIPELTSYNGILSNTGQAVDRLRPETRQVFADIAEAIKKTYPNMDTADRGARNDVMRAAMNGNTELQSELAQIAEKNGFRSVEHMLQDGSHDSTTRMLERFLAPVLNKTHPELLGDIFKHLNSAQVESALRRIDDSRQLVNQKMFSKITDPDTLFMAEDRSFLDPYSGHVSPEYFKDWQEHHRENLEEEMNLADRAKIDHYHEGSYNNIGSLQLNRAAKIGELDNIFKRATDNADSFEVRRGSEPYRFLRDYLEKLEKEGKESAIDPKDLPKGNTFISPTFVTKTAKDGSQVKTAVIDWNPLRDPKKGGKITKESVQKFIDSMPTTKYNVSHTEWGGAQRHSDDFSQTMVVSLTDDHLKKIKEAGLWLPFRKVMNELPHSHPQHPMAIGWVRYTGTVHLPIRPSHKARLQLGDIEPFTDEAQTDIPYAIEKANIPEDQAAKLQEIMFGNTFPTQVIHETFHEAARQSGLENMPVRIHSSDSKKYISLQNVKKPVPVHFDRNYEKVPKNVLNAEPATYGEKPDETHNAIQGKRIWQTYFKKSEEYSDWDV